MQHIHALQFPLLLSLSRLALALLPPPPFFFLGYVSSFDVDQERNARSASTCTSTFTAAVPFRGDVPVQVSRLGARGSSKADNVS